MQNGEIIRHEFIDEELEPQVNIENAVAKRGKAIQWKLIENFNLKEDALSKVGDEYKIDFSNTTKKGDTVVYYCKKHGKKCVVKKKIFYNSEDNTCAYFESLEQIHSGGVIMKGINESMKSKINQYINAGIKGGLAILSQLKIDGQIDLPKRSQINNYIATLKAQKKQPRYQTNQFIEWCEKNSHIPSDVDTPYVFGHCLDNENHTLRAAVSTRRMLGYLILAGSFQIDCTHDLNCDGLPVAISGISDKNRVFHPTAFFLLSSESQEDYEFCFSSLLAGLNNIGYNFNPKVLISDCDSSISAAFNAKFNYPKIHLKCWYHVEHNIETRLKTVDNILARKELLKDIKLLQTSPSIVVFNMASRLFIEKWTKNVDIKVIAFLNYFSAQYLEKDPYWYEGAAPGYPSTNNGLESYNSVIKNIRLLRSQLEIGI